MAIRGTIKGTSDAPAPDGAQTLFIEIEGHGEVEVAIPEDDLVDVVAHVQNGFVQRRAEMVRPPEYLMLEVDAVRHAHGTDHSALLVETAQMGAFVLILTAETIAQMRAELDAVEAALSNRAKPN